MRSSALKPCHVRETDILTLKLTPDGKWFTTKHESTLGYSDSRPAANLAWQVPERESISHGCWHFAATDSTVSVLSALWPREQLRFLDEDTKATYDFRCLSIESRELNAKRYADYMESQVVPEHSYVMHEDLPLAGYQQVGLVNSVRQEGYGLFMEQGTGKTAVVIARVCNEAMALSEGRIDYERLRHSESRLRNTLATEIADSDAVLQAEAEEALERKRKKLEAAAKRRAEAWPVEYSGRAGNAVMAAQRAVREAEIWLAERLRRVVHEVETLRAGYQSGVELRKAAAAAELTAACERRIKALEPTRVAGEDRMYRAIVVAPNNVRMNWYHEFERFKTCQGRVVVIRGTEIARAKQMVEAFTRQPGDKFVVVVISYDTLTAAWPLIRMTQWDLAVLDESHYIKTPNAQRTKTAMKLRDLAEQRMCLTGTPITNHVMDLYSQFEFLGEGCSGFRTFKSFKSFYGVFETSAAGYEKLVGCQNMPLMQDRLARLSFIIKKEVALPDLPDKVYDVVEVEMTNAQGTIYRKMADELLVELEEYVENAENAAMAAQHVLTRLLRLAQITSGHAVIAAEYDDDGEELSPRRVIPITPNPKVEAFMSLLAEKPANEKVIVWACWVEDIRQLSEALEAAGIGHVLYYGQTSDVQRAESERAFNHDPACRVFIGNPTAGGTGLTLLGYPPGQEEHYTTNCTQAVYFSQNWSPTARSQSEDRCHRRGTRKHIRITDLCVPNTIDQKIRARVLKKRQTADSIADVRDILRSIREGTE